MLTSLAGWEEIKKMVWRKKERRIMCRIVGIIGNTCVFFFGYIKKEASKNKRDDNSEINFIASFEINFINNKPTLQFFFF